MNPPTSTTDQSSTSSRSLPVLQLVVLTLIRLIFNTAYSMTYPFLPEISRGLGISTDAGRVLISVRSLAGLGSPLLGPASDRYGRRIMMLAALLLFVVAMLLMPLKPVFTVALIAFFMMGLTKAINDQAVLAYIGDRVPYERRGLAIGFSELGWSGALFIGAPLIGLSIVARGWLSPFVWLAILAAGGAVVLLLVVPSDSSTPSAPDNGFLHSWHLLLRQPAALGVAAFAFLVSMANENIFAVYGDWMEGTFGLQVGALGLVTAVIGAADLVGELAIAGLSDRLGKRRILVVGLIVSTFSYVTLPLTGALGLQPALIMLFIMFLGLEVAFVGSLPIASEALPAARGTMMAAMIAASSIGRAVGAQMGGWLWNAGGFALNGFAAGLLNIVALLVVVVVVSERAIRTTDTFDASA